ncbi:MAG: hypothetical protein WCH07_07885 [Deltaproteobacteria bacterium]
MRTDFGFAYLSSDVYPLPKGWRNGSDSSGGIQWLIASEYADTGLPD